MQQGKVYRNGVYIGLLSKENEDKYIFEYDVQYINSKEAKAISPNLRLQKEPFVSQNLFPFFFNMLSEGTLKEIQCKTLRIDMSDDFSRLLLTTKENTIGSVTIEPIKV